MSSIRFRDFTDICHMVKNTHVIHDKRMDYVIFHVSHSKEPPNEKKARILLQQYRKVLMNTQTLKQTCTSIKIINRRSWAHLKKLYQIVFKSNKINLLQPLSENITSLAFKSKLREKQFMTLLIKHYQTHMDYFELNLRDIDMDIKQYKFVVTYIRDRISTPLDYLYTLKSLNSTLNNEGGILSIHLYSKLFQRTAQLSLCDHRLQVRSFQNILGEFHDILKAKKTAVCLERIKQHGWKVRKMDMLNIISKYTTFHGRNIRISESVIPFVRMYLLDKNLKELEFSSFYLHTQTLFPLTTIEKAVIVNMVQACIPQIILNSLFKTILHIGHENIFLYTVQ